MPIALPLFIRKGCFDMRDLSAVLDQKPPAPSGMRSSALASQDHRRSGVGAMSAEHAPAKFERATGRAAGSRLTLRALHIIKSVFRLAAPHRSFNVRSCECAGNLKTCWTKPLSPPVPLWKLDVASQWTAPSSRLRGQA
jgi:hypothetical protein